MTAAGIAKWFGEAPPNWPLPREEDLRAIAALVNDFATAAIETHHPKDGALGPLAFDTIAQAKRASTDLLAVLPELILRLHRKRTVTGLTALDRDLSVLQRVQAELEALPKVLENEVFDVPRPTRSADWHDVLEAIASRLRAAWLASGVKRVGSGKATSPRSGCQH